MMKSVGVVLKSLHAPSVAMMNACMFAVGMVVCVRWFAVFGLSAKIGYPLFVFANVLLCRYDVSGLLSGIVLSSLISLWSCSVIVLFDVCM